MKSKIISFTVLASFVFASLFSFAQTETSIKKGRIFTSDGEKILFHNLVIGDSNHRYQSSSRNSFLKIPSSDVVRIEKQVGSEAIKWGLICGLAGLTGSVLGVLEAHTQTQSAYGDGVEVNVVPIIVGLTGACTLMGVWVGSRKKKYKLVYSNPKYSSGFWNQRINMDMAVSKNSARIVFRYRL